MEFAQLVPTDVQNLASPEGHVSVPAVALPGRQGGFRSNESTLRDQWHVLLKRKWLILAVIVVATVIAAVVSLRKTPIYQATSRIVINRPSNVLGLKTGDPTYDADYDATVEMDTQIKVLQSDAIAWQVIKNLQLDTNDRLTGAFLVPAKAANPPVLNMDPKREAALLGTFRSALRVANIPRTRVVEITFSSRDPKLAAAVANEMVRDYIEHNFKAKFEATTQTTDWLTRQLSDLKLKVEASQEALVDYQKQKNIVGIDEKQNITTQKLDEINRQLTAAEADRIDKESLYRTLEKPGAVPRAGASPELQKLHENRDEASTELSQLQVSFGPSYPKVAMLQKKVQQIDDNIAKEIGQVRQQAKSEYEMAAQRERMLSAALDRQKQLSNTLNESAIQYNILKRDLETNRTLYESLLERLKEAGISASLRSENIQIVDAARIPIAPALPNVPQDVLLGFLLGLFGGVALAFVTESMDNTIRVPEDVSSIAGLNVLGVVPLSRNFGKDTYGRRSLPKAGALAINRAGAPSKVEHVSLSRPKSELAECYRALRTSILLSAHGAPKVILVTSSLPQEGKTTTSVNTAIVLAQRGARVLLVDADMRRPGVSRGLALANDRGLSSLLTSTVTDSEVIVRHPEVPTLSIITAGPIPSHPAELLESKSIGTLIDRWRTEYDHIVIDTPPLLSVTDAAVLSARADAVLLVVRASRTTKEAVRRARNLMVQVQARLLGVVVNAFDLDSPDAHYYYYYGSKYYNGGYYSQEADKA